MSPYKNIKDANSGIRGIKPPVTVEQANHIAEMADAIDSENPWPIAISTFKREYTVRGGKWVKRTDVVEEHAQETIARLAKEWNMKMPITAEEASALKAQARKILLDADAVLGMKGVSPALHKLVVDIKTTIKHDWEELAEVVDHLPNAESDTSEEGGAAPANAIAAEAPSEEPSTEESSEDVSDSPTEEAMQKGSESYPSSDFLVCEDKDKSTTWHLQVRKHGKPDHGLMGGAWAALHGGYRGNKYEGPNKEAALSKLKALYKSEDMSLPGLSEVAVGLNTLTSMVGDSFRKMWSDSRDSYPSVVGSPSSPWVKEVFIEHPTLGSSIICEMNGVLYMVPYEMDPATGVTFVPREEWKPVVQTYQVITPTKAYEAESEPVREALLEYLEEEVLVESLSEDSSELRYVQLEEANTHGDVDNVVPLRMKVAFIYPGFGNSRDNHYYPAATLRKDAAKFKGLKMYESDHRASEKSTRTWVSTIEDAGSEFTQEGAPIASVVIHDPNFAQRAIALSAAGQLRKLECSILSSGKARKGKVDGREAKIVEEITDPESVDWVTRAGAGGKALQLSESDTFTEKEVSMTGQVSKKEGTTTEEPVTETAENTEATQTTSLAEDVVLAELGKVRIPDAAKTRLSKGSYTTVDELKEAVTAEVEYLKEITNSGKPFEQSGEARPTETKLSEAEYETKMKGIGQKYGIGIYSKEVSNG